MPIPQERANEILNMAERRIKENRPTDNPLTNLIRKAVLLHTMEEFTKHCSLLDYEDVLEVTRAALDSMELLAQENLKADGRD